MPTFESIDQFLNFMSQRPEAVQVADRLGRESAGRLLVECAKDLIGYEHDEWAPLADSTVEEKQRLGYTGRLSPTDPLLRTGSYRASIIAETPEAVVDLGSTDPIAPFQEEGTFRIPARHVIELAMRLNAEEASIRVMNYQLGALVGKDRDPLVPIRRHENEPTG